MRFAAVALLCASLVAPSLRAGEVPRPAPDFSIMMPGGKPLPLKSLHGKVVVLAFIYTTCSHCQALITNITPLAREYAPKGVQFVASAWNDGVNDKVISDFVNQFHPGFPVGMDDRASVYTFL